MSYGLLRLLALALVVVPALSAASVQPPKPLFTLKQADPQAIFDNTTLLAALGSSQQGIKTLLQHNRFGLADGLPDNLIQEEPGATLLAAAVEAYFLFYPLVDLVVRSEAQANTYGLDNYNKWWKLPQINTTENSTQGNGVTFYTSSWIDLSYGPLVFEVPKTEHSGFWTIVFFDAYLEEYAAIGTQRTGNKGGRWLLVGPGSDAAQKGYYGFSPDRVLSAPTVQGSVLGRIAKNTPDAKAFTEGFKITGPDGKDPTTPKSFGYHFTDPEKALQAVDNLNGLYFFHTAGEASVINPKPNLQNPLARQLKELGFSANGFHPDQIRDKISDVAVDALTHAPAIAAQLIEARYLNLGLPSRNYWSQWVDDERWGTDYLLGAAIIKGFWVANYVEDASYNYQYLDSTGRPLHGSNTYRLSFKEAPPHDSRAFWSLQVFNLELLTYPGPGENGYGAGYKAQKVITSRDDGLSVRHDGSYDIILSPEEPPNLRKGENWLKTFDVAQHLILRVYGGGKEVISDSYIYPPAVRVDRDGRRHKSESLRASRKGSVAAVVDDLLGWLKAW